MEKLRGLIDAGQIDRQVLEETSSSSEALVWLKNNGRPKQCACEEGSHSCGCKNKDEQAISIYGPDHPRFYQ